MESLTLKQKDKIVRNIYKNFQRSQLDILYFNQHYNYYSQVDLFSVKDTKTTYKKADSAFVEQLERKQKLENFVSIVNQIHNHLTKDCFSFIESEYLNYYDSLWWMSYYSRASYYRMKHKALDEFLDYAQVFWSPEELMKLIK